MRKVALLGAVALTVGCTFPLPDPILVTATPMPSRSVEATPTLTPEPTPTPHPPDTPRPVHTPFLTPSPLPTPTPQVVYVPVPVYYPPPVPVQPPTPQGPTQEQCNLALTRENSAIRSWQSQRKEEIRTDLALRGLLQGGDQVLEIYFAEVDQEAEVMRRQAEAGLEAQGCSF